MKYIHINIHLNNAKELFIPNSTCNGINYNTRETLGMSLFYIINVESVLVIYFSNL